MVCSEEELKGAKAKEEQVSQKVASFEATSKELEANIQNLETILQELISKLEQVNSALDSVGEAVPPTTPLVTTEAAGPK